MARNKSFRTSSDINTEIIALTALLMEAKAKESQQLGEIALKFGLEKIERKELEQAFKELAARFQVSPDK